MSSPKLPTHAPSWTEIELTFESAIAVVRPYETDIVVRFSHTSGQMLERPAFWDGGAVWRVRFSSPYSTGEWSWRINAPQLTDVDGTGGTLIATAATGQARWNRHGLLRVAPGLRGVVHADGTPWLLCADTAWAIPFRATREEVAAYAGRRAEQGFNAVLLMAVQPDMHAPPSHDRTGDGWDEGFADLSLGRLRELRPSYFQTLDGLVDELLARDLVPVWQPCFQGYGWRGGPVVGRIVPEDDMARFMRYLIARYGARPALWLPGGDGPGTHPAVAAAGEAAERWDAYGQPTGIHYAPNASNREHQDAPWLDFQWCQTGHSGEHKPERVAEMWANRPVHLVANGETTYEQMGDVNRATGWWQGEEAWRNLCAGSTMGVVYGAGSLWSWRRTPSEPDQLWTHSPGNTWREALLFPGADHVGRVARILAGLPVHLARPAHDATYGRPGLLAPGVFFLTYLHEGGFTMIISPDVPPAWRAFDAMTGEVVASGVMPHANSGVDVPEGRSLVVLFEAPHARVGSVAG